MQMVSSISGIIPEYLEQLFPLIPVFLLITSFESQVPQKYFQTNNTSED